MQISAFCGLSREPFGFENRGHIAQDLVFAFRSPNRFFEAIWCFHACRCVNFHVFRDFHAPRCEFPRFSRLSPRSKFFGRQPQKQKPYFGDPRSHITRKKIGFAPETAFTHSRASELQTSVMVGNQPHHASHPDRKSVV